MPTYQQADKDEEEQRVMYHGISAEEWNELVIFITQNHPYVTTGVKTAERLADYGLKGFSVPAMYRFKKWAEKNKYSDMWIMGNILHDLNHYRDILFEPRTASY